MRLPVLNKKKKGLCHSILILHGTYAHFFIAVIGFSHRVFFYVLKKHAFT